MVAVRKYSQMDTKRILNKPTVKASVVLGVITKQCKGKGICAVIMDPPLDQVPECNHIEAMIRLHPDHTLSFRFQKSSFQPCTYEKYFNDRFFEVEETFMMPLEILQHLAIEEFSISAGQYLLVEDKYSYQVNFPLAG